MHLAGGLARPAFREAGNRGGDVRAGAGEGALGHGDGASFRHRPIGGEDFLGDPQHLVLGLVGVGDEAALEGVRLAGDVGEQGGQQSAGAAFGGGELQAPIAGFAQHEAGQVVDGGRHGGIEGFGHGGETRACGGGSGAARP